MKELNKLIEEGKIKWLPWIGQDYLNNKHKILIIGESHYYNPEENGSFEKHQSPTFTQEVVDEMAIQRDYYQTKIFQNLHRALLGNDQFRADLLWNNIAFYNFIQKPMNTNKGRPNYNDFLESWSSFESIVKILNPTLVIFIGTSSANSFNEFSNNLTTPFEKVECLEKIGASYAKYCSITIREKTPIYFIRHTSQYFSWTKWNEFLNKKISLELNWLNNLVENQ